MELAKEKSDKNLIFGKYKIQKIIGSGSFGNVYQGINVVDKKGVAIKVEKKELGLNLLEKESFYLYNLKGIGVPEVISYGYSGKYNVLVQTLLGESLGKIFHKNKNHFSIKDLCMFSIQILDRMEYVHSKYIIHRDIKPENFLIGDPDKYMIYIIDFGLSKKYKSSRTNKHVQFRLTKKFTGTARYASINAVRGAEQSRRDDLEAIGYMLLYFLNGGNLPWQGVSCKAKAEKYVKIYHMKKNLNFSIFCKNMPQEIVYFIKYCRELEFEQKPDYDYLRSLFENILKERETTNDLHFSWIKDLSILKDIKTINNKVSLVNMGKRKESPRSRIYKKLETSREVSKEKENKEESKSKILKTNKSSKNIENIIILKSPTYNQFIIHKRYKSTDSDAKANKDSENLKSGVALYNVSIDDDEQMNSKPSANKKVIDINIVKDCLLKNKDMPNKDRKILKDNLFYFSKNVSLNQTKEKNINDSNLNNTDNPNDNIKMQNSSLFNHNRIFSSNSINNNSNINYISNNNFTSPNIVKSLSYVKKILPNEEKVELKKINKDLNLNINNIENIPFNKNYNKKILKKFNNLKANNIIIKKQNSNVNIYRNKSNNFFNNSTNINRSKNNNNFINMSNNTVINKSKPNTKNKKILKNIMKKDNKKRKLIKINKNVPNITIQDPLNNNIKNNNINHNILNCKSAANILKKNISPNNSQQNIKYTLIQKNNNIKKQNLIKKQNMPNSINNIIDGKINKPKNMNVHSNIKKNSQNHNKKYTTQELFNSNLIANPNHNLKRITKYTNTRHKVNPILKSATTTNNDSIQKMQINKGTINTTINNSNTINNTITTNKNNNTIISIYNNYNLSKNVNGNKYGFIHKKVNSNNIALNTLHNINSNININKGKNNYSYNGYNLKINNYNYNNYIHLNNRKNSTLTNVPSLNQVFNINYNTLNSIINNDNPNNHYNSQILSNKDYLIQERHSKQKLEDYLSLRNFQTNINEYQKGKIKNLSSSRPNCSYRNIIKELKMDIPKVNGNQRNTTKNYINMKTNFFLNKKDMKINQQYKSYNDSFDNINRCNSFIYSSNLINNFHNKERIKSLDINYPTVNRKQTDIFYHRIPNFKLNNYNIYNNKLFNDNFETFHEPRAQSNDYNRLRNNKSNKDQKPYNFF